MNHHERQGSIRRFRRWPQMKPSPAISVHPCPSVVNEDSSPRINTDQHGSAFPNFQFPVSTFTSSSPVQPRPFSTWIVTAKNAMSAKSHLPFLAALARLAVPYTCTLNALRGRRPQCRPTLCGRRLRRGQSPGLHAAILTPDAKRHAGAASAKEGSRISTSA
jgi:hypothetical protein